MNKKHLLFALLMMFAFAPEWSIAQIRTPLPSPPATVYTQVGLTDVTVDYFRPRMKGREIFGEGDNFLVPYGKIWRTGANSGSKITFSDNITIMGQEIKAGDYLIFTVPGQNEWQVMLYSDLTIGGNTTKYDKANEAGSFTVTPSATGEKVEALTFLIEDISEDNTKASLALMWENTKVELPFEVAFDEKIMSEIKAKTQVDPRNYLAAANYYYQSGRDLDQALEWINMYLENNPNQFWNVHLKAQILAKMGKDKEAIEAAQQSIKIADAAEDDFGYIKRNEQLIEQVKNKK
ncbi:MAG: DUF2911 domain-containing protein [Candidatus Cyclobacteriaceae bacterium M2_1C_046]